MKLIKFGTLILCSVWIRFDESSFGRAALHPWQCLILVEWVYNLKTGGEVLFRNTESTVMCMCPAIKELQNLISKNLSGVGVSPETATLLEHGFLPAPSTPANWRASIRKRVKKTASVCFTASKWPDWLAPFPVALENTSDVVSEVCGWCQPASPHPHKLHQEQVRGLENQHGQLLAPFTLLLMPSLRWSWSYSLKIDGQDFMSLSPPLYTHWTNILNECIHCENSGQSGKCISQKMCSNEGPSEVGDKELDHWYPWCYVP